MKELFSSEHEANAVGAMDNVEFREELMKCLEEEMTETEKFCWLYSMTMAIYDLEELDYPCSKGHIKRWCDLADIWGRCAASRGEPNIFVLAIHKIHWGVYPANFPEHIPLEMVEVVERALIQNGEDYRGWKMSMYYYEAFDLVIEQVRPLGKHVPAKRLEWYLKYIRNKTWLRIAYKETAPPTVDLSHYTRSEFVAARKHAEIYSECRGYETVITKLIPDAASWDQSQWSNERLLYKHLEHIYGITMERYAREFNSTIDFLIELWYYQTTSIKHLLEIKDMPDALMKAIWPNRTQHDVTKLLALAYSRVKSAHTYLSKYNINVHGCTWKKLVNSWIYKCCRNWVYGGTLFDAMPKTRKNILEIESGIAEDRQCVKSAW